MAKAIATGRVLHDPKRFAGRNEPESNGPLGPPPAWLKKAAADAWLAFDDELPWLNRSHRCIVGIASIARAELAASRRHLYTLESEHKFPKRVALGENRVGWIESEVDDWIKEKAACRAA
jgi:predicted DNA-binding transcriptional regulator AlpA